MKNCLLKFNVKITLYILFILIIPILGCDNILKDLNPATGVIDKKGGTIQNRDKSVTVEVPAGAVEKSTTMAVVQTKEKPDGYINLSPVYLFEPDGIHFKQPVTVKMRYDSSKLPVGSAESSLKLMWTNEKGEFEPVESTVDTANKIVAGKVTHFSKGFVGFGYKSVCCKRSEGFLDNHLPKEECIDMHGTVVDIPLNKCRTICCFYNNTTQKLDYPECEQKGGQDACIARGLECGDDGCGGSCGSCPQGKHCNAGKCVEATQQSVVWTLKLDGDFVTAPPIVAEDGTIYLANSTYTNKPTSVYAITPDGKIKWKVSVPVEASSPALDSNASTLYIGGRDNNLYAINTGDGAIKWKLDLSEGIGTSLQPTTPVVGSDGTIFVTTNVNFLMAITRDGKLKWRATIDNTHGYRTSPGIGPDGTVYTGANHLGQYSNSDTYYLYAFDGKAAGPDVSNKWKFQLDSIVDSSPSIAKDGTVYIGLKHSTVYAINTDGSLKWKFDSKDSSSFDITTAIGSDGTIYALRNDNSGKGKLFAISPDNGTQKWTYELASGGTGSPIVGPQDEVYVVDLNGNVYAINNAGKEDWVFKIAGYIKVSPALSSDNKVLYVVTLDGTLYAIKLMIQSNQNAPWPLWRHDPQNTGLLH